MLGRLLCKIQSKMTTPLTLSFQHKQCSFFSSRKAWRAPPTGSNSPNHLAMAPKCGVCVDSESKYKCPVCLTPYCSLPCYRTHKETPCSKPVASLEVGEEKAPGQPPRSFEEDEDESGWRLRRSQLEALAASDDIRQMLRDDELRKLIQKVDSSVTPEKDLDKAMEGSAFREFTDKVLAMINLDEHSHLTQS